MFLEKQIVVERNALHGELISWWINQGKLASFSFLQDDVAEVADQSLHLTESVRPHVCLTQQTPRAQLKAGGMGAN